MESVSDVLAKMKAARGNNQGGLSHNWRDEIPSTSRWLPGDPGDPYCKVCGGTGYVRLDLPLGHPLFGRIHWCDCVSPEKIAKLRLAADMAKK